ncbi:8692_t:CDS:1 [Ambispora gerdemannii]|uniref:8692_t:CDS:1 n=1 Tax=Ambispora gerdemannii TaxID=144530 RepID=A0A9N9F1C6_9GLOM|nr:8692_t:CDS:1 [Ambispora gerdemannii]
MFRWKHVIPLAERGSSKLFLTRDSDILPLSFISFSWSSPLVYVRATFNNPTRQPTTLFIQPDNNKFVINSTIPHYSKFYSIFVSKPKINTTTHWPLTFSRHKNLSASSRDCILHVRRYPHSKTPSTSTRIENAGESLSMFSRLKLLTRRYGASAVVIYLAISAMDLAATFILLQSGGGERVKKIEDWITETFGINTIYRQNRDDNKDRNLNTTIMISSQENNTTLSMITNDDGGNSGSDSTKQTPSLMSTLVIAYGIHKILLPLRLGVTAAMTPPLVRKLRSMGWDIGRQI